MALYNMDNVYAAWHAIGADVAGLEWNKFVEALHQQPKELFTDKDMESCIPISKVSKKPYVWLTKGDAVDALWNLTEKITENSGTLVVSCYNPPNKEQT